MTHELETTPPLPARETLAWIVDLWRPLRRRLVPLVLFTCASAFLRVAFPYLHQFLVDRLRAGEAIGAVVALVLGTGVLRSVVYGALQYTRASTNYLLEPTARQRIFARVIELGPGALEKHPTGDLLARLSDDCGDKFAWFACSGIFRLLEATLVIGIAIVALVLISPWITLVAVAPLPLIALVYLFTASRLDAIPRWSTRFSE